METKHTAENTEVNAVKVIRRLDFSGTEWHIKKLCNVWFALRQKGSCQIIRGDSLDAILLQLKRIGSAYLLA
jgi:hypothetical protein